MLGPTGLTQVQDDVLFRLIHSSGDLGIAPLVRFSPGACEAGLEALKSGAVVLTDTSMAAAAVAPMASRTFGNPVYSILNWAPLIPPDGKTRAEIGMGLALSSYPRSIVLIGSAPTALKHLIQSFHKGVTSPALVIGMPVGFVGVLESKKMLAATKLNQIRIEGSRGGAGLVAAALNALFRHEWLRQ